MRAIAGPTLPLFLVFVVGCAGAGKSAESLQEMPNTEAAEPARFEVSGKTQPAPGRIGTIAPTVLHPVTQVLVAAGDRVKKGQPLVKLDDDEPRADVRAKQAVCTELQAGLARVRARPLEEEKAEARAQLDSARINAAEAAETLRMLTSAYQNGSIPSKRYLEAKNAVHRFEAEKLASRARLERLVKQPVRQEAAEMEAKVAAAQAALEASQAELEHYTLVAPVDGVVSWLDVNPGTVSRPGTSVWGEVLDLREVDVLCELTLEQAERVHVGQPAAVARDDSCGSRWGGRDSFVGIAAGPHGERLPVRVRVANPEGRLRCYVTVKVQFGQVE